MKKKQPWARLGLVTVTASAVFLPGIAYAGSPTHSVARQWNEQLLAAIRVDYARPTVHARNLYHVSVAMWDVIEVAGLNFQGRQYGQDGL